MNISLNRKFHPANTSYAESFVARQRKDSGGVVFFTEQAAVNAAARELVTLRGIEVPQRAVELDRQTWTYHHHVDERPAPRVESALIKLYLDTFHVLRTSRQKRSFTGEGRIGVVAKPFKIREESKTTLYHVTPNYDAATFVPSPELVSFWLDGVNSVRSEGGKAPIYVSSLGDFEFYSAELVRSLDTVLSNFAKIKAYDGGRYHMTFGGKILSTIETLIVDELLIPPSFTSNFVKELHKLLVSQSELRPRFSGRWGKLILDDRRELIFDLIRRSRRTLAQVLKG